jgi:ribosomal protein S18 acetylase RimI-like enzyme
MTYQRESLIENRAELEPLFVLHWNSVTPDFEDAELGFNWDAYAGLELAGAVHFMVLRDEGKIVGYQLCLMSPHLHSQASMTAHTVFYYLLPTYRDRMIPSRLFRETEKSLKATGVHHAYLGFKSDHDLSPILVRLGYHQVETIHAKRL